MSALEISTLEFRQLASRVTDLAAEYLETLATRETFPSEATGPKSEALFDKPLPEQGMGFTAAEALRDVLRLSRAPSPRFFGYVLGSGDPVAGTADLLASVLNQNVTAWRSGPAAVTIERVVVRWLAEAIGCPKLTGSLTGGGSSANLMGLMMAREARRAANESGSHGGVVYASSEVHMSIGKAMALLGLGYANLSTIPVDENFRMRVDELERAIDQDRREGRHAIAVVASAGTTGTGSIDPLPEIAEVASRNGLWMHVDGAYGALAAIAEPEKFRGLEQADSLSLDPHKWLYQPLDCGCLLFRDRGQANRAFAHSGEYARSLYADPIEGFAFFEESMELSRRFRALKLWLSLRYHGLEKFRQAIRDDLRHARLLADRVRQTPELELLAPVELSAVCFRHRGGDNAFQERILKRVVQRGKVYISNAQIHGKFALRACFVNHRTTDSDAVLVVAEVLAAAREI
jgi:aromatic-L-amino-acid decarboxylase